MADYTTSIDIHAPPEIVFAHLVTPEGLLAWMGEHAELEPTPGGAFVVDIRGTPIRGRYLEIDPPRRVVVSWGVAGSEDFPPGSSQVEFTLTPTEDGTRLDLAHTDLREAKRLSYTTGWAHFLGRLQTVAAGLDSGADRWAPAPSATSEHGRTS